MPSDITGTPIDGVLAVAERHLFALACCATTVWLCVRRSSNSALRRRSGRIRGSRPTCRRWRAVA